PEKILGRIKGTTRHVDLADCDLVVEAVFEDLGIKRGLIAELEKHVRDDCVLATNTSSFKVAAVAEGAAHPERIVGLHYFFHPAQNRLLEVIPGPQTSVATVEKSWAFAEATGKTAIHSADSPGFVVNRFFVPWLNENVRLLEEGVADLPTIEETNKRFFGVGMGPFVLMNVTGVPIAQHACEGLASELGPFYAPCELLKQQVAAKQNWEVQGQASDAGVAEVEERLLGVVLLVAASLVGEGVSSAEDTDIGAMVGLRWPLGPFAMANKVGIERAIAAATAVAGKYDLRLPELLSGRSEPFALQAVDLNVEDGVARITMNRPNAMNALDPETVGSLARAFDAAAADANVEAIVIEGRGKAFVAGADIKFFIKGIDDGDIPRIVGFTRAGQELLLRIDKCEKPVVARLNGLALGGGAELALACDAIVADEGAAIGFPETGIGIYPGLGGTQRLAKRAGLPVARYMVLLGDVLPAGKAAALGVVDRVAGSGESMGLVKQLLDTGAVEAGEGAGGLAQPGAAKGAVEALYTGDNVAAMLAGTFEPSDDGAAKVAKKIGFKAPIALQMAEELIAVSLDTPIDQGVELELAGLPKIFSTADARQGLGSVIDRTRPKYEGK
ncbi:MAG: enoyl-CoA hydratase/isomerase family protein, partial [Deltaproteobacteria bacterium]|nr:enoyl-CoA hydratase/isomerase family protein [Deltaproteobacteria bacterium]